MSTAHTEVLRSYIFYQGEMVTQITLWVLRSTAYKGVEVEGSTGHTRVKDRAANTRRHRAVQITRGDREQCRLEQEVRSTTAHTGDKGQYCTLYRSNLEKLSSTCSSQQI